MDTLDMTNGKSVFGSTAGLALFTIILAIAVVTFLSAYIDPKILKTDRWSTKAFNDYKDKETLAVPCILIRNTIDDLDPKTGKIRYQRSMDRFLEATITGYQKEISNALQGLSKMLEQALLLENSLMVDGTSAVSEKIRKDARLSTRVEARIQRMAKYLEHNEKIVIHLLESFSYTMALPATDSVHSTQTTHQEKNYTKKDNNQPPLDSNMFQMSSPIQQKRQLFNGPESETHSYDSAIQIVAHLTRDWTKEGQMVRRSIYDWCCAHVIEYVTKNQGAKILVPGAGMGRLAYDLFQQGYHVEANEISPSMAAAACAVLQRKAVGYLHPYLLDVMANEVDSERRYDIAPFPDVKIHTASSSNASLSYTVGDFAGGQNDTYYLQRQGSFDAIVTCFFIDTAHDIYEYLGMIEGLLTHKTGIWVNVGPVQWHPNAVSRPSVNEFKDLVESFGWKIKVWSIDKDPVSYRETDNNFVRMTNYEGYRCLRFVAVRPR